MKNIIITSSIMLASISCNYDIINKPINKSFTNTVSEKRNMLVYGGDKPYLEVKLIDSANELIPYKVITEKNGNTGIFNYKILVACSVEPNLLDIEKIKYLPVKAKVRFEAKTKKGLTVAYVENDMNIDLIQKISLNTSIDGLTSYDIEKINHIHVYFKTN